ncbi:hypothetical protein BLOT_010507 [Blomia tropicalis]|nr:hypothetical protein BLOT_010507 [Blomia tropicalis]
MLARLTKASIDWHNVVDDRCCGETNQPTSQPSNKPVNNLAKANATCPQCRNLNSKQLDASKNDDN